MTTRLLLSGLSAIALLLAGSAGAAGPAAVARAAAAVLPKPALPALPAQTAVARLATMRAALESIRSSAPSAPAPGTRISPTALPSGPSPTSSGGVPSLPTTIQVGTTATGAPVYSPVVVSGSFQTYPPNAPLVVAGAFNGYQIGADPKTAGHVIGTITQTGNAGILQWASFDIGADATLNIIQPSSTATLLNRVAGGNMGGSYSTLNPTIIEGMLNGNGQVYILNPNGIVFGKTSVIDVNSLVASSLNISNNTFLSGVLSAINNNSPAFSTAGPAGPVTVEGDSTGQAQITAANGGKILLLAPSVTNDGLLSAPNGQVVLAAGNSVYLSAPTDPSMRGFFVEVSNANGQTPGAATNDVLGNIRVGTGNTSIVGYAVNQMGTVNATTSVSLNGSIYLHADSGAQLNNGTVDETIAGSLVLGPGSVTEIDPALSDTTTTATSTAFIPSTVQLHGETIDVAGTVSAKGGTVSVLASSNPLTAFVAGSPDDGKSRIYLEPTAIIDVSGTTTTSLPMSANILDIYLSSNELQDDPLLRDNPAVHGQTVAVDTRIGAPIISASSWQAYLNTVPLNVGQHSAAGGTVSLVSDGDVITTPGSSIDVSGGYVSYQSGNAATSQLTYAGRVFGIGTAMPNLPYDGVLAPIDTAQNYQPGYIQGYSAGSVTVDTTAAVLRGSLAGNVTTGPLQRSVGNAGTPLGGTLVLGSYANYSGAGAIDERNANPNQIAFALSGSIDFGGTGNAGLATPAFTDTLDAKFLATLDIDPAALTQAGFNQIQASSNSGITVEKNAPLNLAPGGSITLFSAGPVNINANVSSTSGAITVASASSIAVGDNVMLDVAGLWTNDSAHTDPSVDSAGRPLSPIATQGGSISLNAPALALGANDSLDVSGGAWLNGTGSLSAGSGGSIKLDSSADPNQYTAATDLGVLASFSIGAGTRFSGYALSQGGSLEMTAYEIDFIPGLPLGGSGGNSNNPSPTGPVPLDLITGFLGSGGFGSYNLRAAANINLLNDAQLAPRMENWVRDANYANTPGGAMSSAFTVGFLPLAGPLERSPVSLALSALDTELVPGGTFTFDSNYGNIDITSGSEIAAEPGATVNLQANYLLLVDGGVSAPGGLISLATSRYGEVWLGAASVLDVSGSTTSLWQNASGLTQGKVTNGGSVNIGSSSVYAATLVANNGALINVAGTAATMTLASGRTGERAQTIASSGGSVAIYANDLLFDGSFSAAGGSVGAANGSLNLNGGGNLVIAGAEPVSGSVVPQGLNPGDTVSGACGGQSCVLAGTLNSGGFDWIRLGGGQQLSFDLSGGSLSLSARAGLIVDAPILSAGPSPSANSTLTLSAPYVELANSNYSNQSVQPASGGNATLQVNAGTQDAQGNLNAPGTLDLLGNLSLQGFSTTNLAAASDVRLIGQTTFNPGGAASLPYQPIEAFGSFNMSGSLSITAAQVYPSSLSQYTLSAGIASGDSISFSSNGSAAPMPLSAAGTLTVNANEITQDGVVRAPLGSIVFNAADTLSYGAASLTSVAASGILPLGFGQNGLDWEYDFGNSHIVNLSDPTATNYVALPEKSIQSNAAKVVFAQGAVQDLSGGGDLYAYEFTAGPGGSHDVLASTGSNGQANVFAIIPGYSGQFAPQDFQNNYNDGLVAGDQVYLSGVPGLAAGLYTLLPAHYSLLPGAYAITALPGTTDMSATQNYQDPVGNLIVAGYQTYLGGGSDSRWSGFKVIPESLVRNESQYTDYSGNAFLAGTVTTLPEDGGHVVFNVTDATGKALSLQGQVLLGGANVGQTGGGYNGIADISAPDIAVLSSATEALPGDAASTAVQLTVAQLTGLGADSLLLGGVRSLQSDGDLVSVGAQQVVVANDASHPLTGPEIILVTGSNDAATSATNNGNIVVESGSAIIAQGAMTGTPQPLQLQNQTNPNIGADGALLRLSNGAAVTVQRGATQTGGTVLVPAGAFGGLDIRSGVTLTAAGSMLLDATASNLIDSPLVPGSAVTALAIDANRISFGSGAQATVPGLILDDTAIQALNAFGALAFTSYSSLDFWGTVNLGSTTMTNLSFSAGGIEAYPDSRDTSPVPAPPQTTLMARNIIFAGAGTFALATPAPANLTGSLSVKATNIQIGSGGFAVDGYATTGLNATGQIQATGQGGVFSADAALDLTAAGISADSGDGATFIAGAQLALHQAAGAAATPPALQFGGKLSFQGASIVSDANITATAGQISFMSGNGITLNGGTISAAGTAETFGNTVAYAPGGSIAMDGGAGKVTIGANATLDVSAVGASAGSLSLKAVNGVNGQVIVDGTLLGAAAAGADGSPQTQGSFTMNADQLASGAEFGGLNARLNAGGFAQSRSFEIGNGDVNLATGQSIVAHQVTVSADNGNINIAGTIDASGPAGGSIELYAAEPTGGAGEGNVTIASGALLNASATARASGSGSQGQGGGITIGTAVSDGSDPAASGEATVALNAGATLNVSGNGVLANAGSITLRAPRYTLASDIAAAAASTTITTITNQIPQTTGTNSYKLSDSALLGATLATGTTIEFIVTNQNTASSTINVTGATTNFGAKALVSSTGGNLASGTLQAGELVYAVYNGTKFEIVSSATADTAFLLSDPALAALKPGAVVTFNLSAPNTGSIALSLSGAGGVNLGVAPLVEYGGQVLAGGEFSAGETVVAVYGLNSSGAGQFQISSATPSGVQAPDTGTRVAVAPIASTIVGTSTVAVEPNKVYNSTTTGNLDPTTGALTIDANAVAQWRTDNFAFMANGASIVAGLKSADPGLAVLLEPGIEVRNSGDIVLATDIDFSSKSNGVWDWRYSTATTPHPQPGQLAPGVLTLRAGGNLILQGSISDGFINNSTSKVSYAMPDWTPDTSGVASWSYRLTGGANLAAANPMATMPSTVSGDVLLTFAPSDGGAYGTPPDAGGSYGSGANAPFALVRTGSGYIDVAAGRDVILDTLDLTQGSPLVYNSTSGYGSVSWTLPAASSYSSDTLVGATIYTTGLATTPVNFTAPTNNLNCNYSSTGCTNSGTPVKPVATPALFGSGGGGIAITASRDVFGAITDQLVTNWLFRQGATDSNGNFINAGTSTVPQYQNTAWWSSPDYFDEGIATFGGGNISVLAQTGDISNLSASVATNAYAAGNVASQPRQQGGGDLVVAAAGDIRGGMFYVQQGAAVVTAGGSVTTGDLYYPGANGLVASAPILAVGNAEFNVTAGASLTLDGAINPTMIAQSSNNTVIPSIGKTLTTNPKEFATFSTYGANSGLDLTAVTGNVTLNSNYSELASLAGSDSQNGATAADVSGGAVDLTSFYIVQPPNLRAASLSGDLNLQGNMTMWPSATGQLSLLAHGSVNGTEAGQITMLDADPASLPSAGLPLAFNASDLFTVIGSSGIPVNTNGTIVHAVGGLHATDPNPVEIVAQTGNIDFTAAADNTSVPNIVLPKEAQIYAGLDITDLAATIQQLNPTDVSTITAGRDILFATNPITAATDPGQTITGPGRVDYSAGRNIDLGDSQGIRTIANFSNSYLPAQGASISMTAGAQPDYANFLQQYGSAAADLSATDQASLVAYVLQINPQLSPGISPDAALAYFNSLPQSERQPWLTTLANSTSRPALDALFYQKLRTVTGAQGGGTLNLTSFDAVIASLFPTGSISDGNINVFGSLLETNGGGTLTLDAPGGSVFAGLANVPGILQHVSASDLGVYSIGGGGIQALVNQNFLVNQGRVFSIGGGDVTLVSQYGNIDAGKGAKTAVSAPPPLLTTDRFGNTTVDLSSSISGSGIATLKTADNQPAANVYPIAPRGIFNAGDAGVRSSGSVSIVAAVVLNANNISAAGGISGAHTAGASISAAPASESNSAPPPQASQMVPTQTPDQTLGLTLSVDLLGYGPDDSQEGVTQDSQNAAPDDSDDDGKKKKKPDSE